MFERVHHIEDNGTGTAIWVVKKSKELVRKYCEKYCELKTPANITNGTMNNYTECFAYEIMRLLERVQDIPNDEFQMKLDFAETVGIVDVVGLTFSSIVLMYSITVYCMFGNLDNDKTRIHKNLFMAALGADLMKLIIYHRQILNGYGNIILMHFGIVDTPFACEISFTLLEYFKTSTYMWMYIEAAHLHEAVAVTAIPLTFKKSYLFLGWFLSGVLVVIWVTVMILQGRSNCWWGYNYSPWYWILEGPRILVLLVNTIYLKSIIKVIYNKLQKNPNPTNRVDIIKKMLKVTLELLPLLGITNYLSHIEPQLDCPLWYYKLYSFMSHSLNSFQGMLIGLLYCFLNEEVKKTVFNRIKMRLLRNEIALLPAAGRTSKRY